MLVSGGDADVSSIPIHSSVHPSVFDTTCDSGPSSGGGECLRWLTPFPWQHEFWSRARPHYFFLAPPPCVMHRPPPQMNMLLGFRADQDDHDDCPCPEEIQDLLHDFHHRLTAHCGKPQPRTPHTHKSVLFVLVLVCCVFSAPLRRSRLLARESLLGK